MARPSNYNYELCEEICEKVANGDSIKKVLSSCDDYPTFQTWCNWKRNNRELFDLYVNTMQDKSENEIDLIEQVYDDLRLGNLEPAAANVLIQTNKWKASKFYPKMFGDKVDVTTQGDKVNAVPSAISVEIIKPKDE